VFAMLSDCNLGNIKYLKKVFMNRKLKGYVEIFNFAEIP
jgi:hypothetical protein